ncbi:hypothetical protein NQZ79_g5131 [Umbelopsis isabellina]|nr:hypothetical protein NQZ79_g5131 [Umbelopsis isabellina]
MVKYTVRERAYALPLLHAARYPSSEVCGVLLTDKASVDSEKINITTAVPLFHHWTTLSPMLEVALQQVDLYAASKDLAIAGWYVANETTADKALNEHIIKTMETILKHNENAIVFLVDNENIDLHQNKDSALLYRALIVVVQPFVKSSISWQPSKSAFTDGSDFELSNVDTYAKVRGLISNGQYKQIADFDAHLEDVSLDWLSNSGVNGL